jgi:hypothetical protein
MDKKDIIILVLIAILGYILLSNNNKTIAEKFINVDIDTLRKQIMDVYRIDVEAIKNLGRIASEIAKNGKFSVPTDLMIAGKISSGGRIDASGSITVQTTDSVGIATNNAIVATGDIRAGANIQDSVGTLAAARAVANTAQGIADDGINRANTAQSAANTAKQTAEQGIIDAAGALTKAKKAVTDAGTAQVAARTFANKSFLKKGGQITGDIYMNDRQLALRNDYNNYIKYIGDRDGPRIQGSGGGQLGTPNDTSLSWDYNNNVYMKKLCIGNTCIDEMHLKVLAGTGYVYTPNEYNLNCFDYTNYGYSPCNWDNARIRYAI